MVTINSMDENKILDCDKFLYSKFPDSFRFMENYSTS